MSSSTLAAEKQGTLDSWFSVALANVKNNKNDRTRKIKNWIFAPAATPKLKKIRLVYEIENNDEDDNDDG